MGREGGGGRGGGSLGLADCADGGGEGGGEGGTAPKEADGCRVGTPRTEILLLRPLKARSTDLSID